MPRAYSRRASCRICGSPRLGTFLSPRGAPLPHPFLPPGASGDAVRGPPEGVRRLACGLVQLTVVVDPEVMFRDYLYATSASAPMRGHFDELAGELVSRFAPKGSFVVEVGSNDGVLLRPLAVRGARALGVEPASNLAA